MKISELIKELKALEAEYGDIPVTAWRNGRLCHIELTHQITGNVLRQVWRNMVVVETKEEYEH